MSSLSQKILIKIGTNVLSQPDGSLNEELMRELARQISSLKKQNIDVVVVTSGAVGAGRSLLPNVDTTGSASSVNTTKMSDVAKRQVLASVGQIKLMNLYSKFFAEQENMCAQVLVTKEDFRDRLHYLNLKNCFEALFKEKIVPLVNENDAISVTELMFTDNDELSGLIAAMLNMDTVIILTNVDGIFDAHPSEKNAKLIQRVEGKMEIEKGITPNTSAFGRGGMMTKSRIANKLAMLGITTHIANGKKTNIMVEIINRYPAQLATSKMENPPSTQQTWTTFLPHKNLSSVKRWIAYARGYEKGIITINEGAETALRSKEKAISLLPVGITQIEGDFEKGEIIKIRNQKGEDIGYGTAQYSSEKARDLIGMKGAKALIHYDYLFLEQAGA